jgi:hypothetical protein
MDHKCCVEKVYFSPGDEVKHHLLMLSAVEEGPIGYPRFAKFLDSDECFMNYRKFGYLQARLLLTRQDELRFLEAQLEKTDKKDKILYPSTLRTCDTEIRPGRKELMDTIDCKFRQYGEIFIRSKASKLIQSVS